MLQPSQRFSVRPHFVKYRQVGNADSITVTVPAFWVHPLLASRAEGHAIQGHLFCPLDASKATFVEQGISSSSIDSPLQSVMNACSLARDPTPQHAA